MGQLLMNEPVLNGRTPSFAQVSKIVYLHLFCNRPLPMFFFLKFPCNKRWGLFFPKTQRVINLLYLCLLKFLTVNLCNKLISTGLILQAHRNRKTFALSLTCDRFFIALPSFHSLNNITYRISIKLTPMQMRWTFLPW